MQHRKKRAYTRLSSFIAVAALIVMPTTAFAAFGDRTLSTGATGHDVRVLQSWLDKMGFHTGIDGAFGRNTRWNLRRFEQAKGLSVNGVLSRSDARTMRGAMSAHYSYAGTGPTTDTDTETAPGGKATMSSDGLHAVAPSDAPTEVQQAIAAANKIVGKPYKYGGGHGSFEDSGYDCSGTVSYALHGAGLLKAPMSSGDFGGWGVSGKGSWISVYYNGGHAYAVIAGLRWDTVGDAQGSGPRWHPALPYPHGFTVRHPPGY